MPVVSLGGMEGGLRGGKGEDQPSVTSVHPRKPEDVAEESAVGVRIMAVDNYVCTIDHLSVFLSSSVARCPVASPYFLLEIYSV